MLLTLTQAQKKNPPSDYTSGSCVEVLPVGPLPPLTEVVMAIDSDVCETDDDDNDDKISALEPEAFQTSHAPDELNAHDGRRTSGQAWATWSLLVYYLRP